MTVTAAASRAPASPHIVKRNTLILSAAQAIVGAAAPVSISIGGLTGAFLLAHDKSLATAPVTGFNLGVALGSIPAALLMRWVGRRYGFVTGALVTAAGGLIAVLAISQASFWLFAAALVVIGMGGAFAQQYRFAAADGAPEAFKPKAISWVLAGGVAAALIGPQTVMISETLLDRPFIGGFGGVIAFGLAGSVILMFLRAPQIPKTFSVSDGSDIPARSMGQIFSQPVFATALLCAVGAYGLMSFVMTGAPLAMVGMGHSTHSAMFGIQWHVMAMFAPSFFTGRLIVRFGKLTIIATGFVLLFSAATVALAGTQVVHFWTALILLGVGWNFGFIGSTSLLTDSYHETEKNKVQGVHDFILFGSVALASLMSGNVLNSFGWSTLNMIVFPVCAICLSALAMLFLRQRNGHRRADPAG